MSDGQIVARFTRAAELGTSTAPAPVAATPAVPRRSVLPPRGQQSQGTSPWLVGAVAFGAGLAVVYAWGRFRTS